MEDALDEDALDEDALDEDALDEDALDEDASDSDPFGAGQGLAGERDPLGIGTFTPVTLTDTNNSSADKDLGPTSDRTCFLQGVTGEFYSAENTGSAMVSVFQSNGRWKLRVRAGHADPLSGKGGSGLTGSATCIPATANYDYMVHVVNPGTNSPAYQYVPDNGFRKCFLSSISTTVGFADPDAFVVTRRQPVYGEPSWILDAGFNPQGTGGISGTVSAVCVDVFFQTQMAYNHQAPSSSNTTWSVLHSSDDTACGVQKIGGNLAGNPYGSSDGVRILGAFGYWLAGAASGKTIGGECYTDLQIFWP